MLGEKSTYCFHARFWPGKVVEAKLEKADEPASAQANRLHAQQLAHAIKTFIGVSAEIVLVPVGAIERSMGKAKRVVDLRKL